MPKISIIVPIYNAQGTLHRTIDSILGQSFADFEILLIDDGSIDGSGHIIDFYSSNDSRVKGFHKKRGGVSSARNMGIDNATGDWVAFCDADDWVYTDWLKAYTENLQPEVDLLIQGCEIEWVGAERSCKREGVSACGKIKDILTLIACNNSFGCVWSCLFSREIIMRWGLRFDERFICIEDVEFTLKYATHCKLGYCINAVGYHYYMPSNFDEKFSYHGWELPLVVSLYDSICHICENDYKSILYDRISDRVLSSLLVAFQNNDADRYVKLETIRKMMGRGILYTRFFWPSKWIVFLDLTYLISPLVLSMHANLKNKRK